MYEVSLVFSALRAIKVAFVSFAYPLRILCDLCGKAFLFFSRRLTLDQCLVAGGDLVPAEAALARERLAMEAAPQFVVAQQIDGGRRKGCVVGADTAGDPGDHPL